MYSKEQLTFLKAKKIYELALLNYGKLLKQYNKGNKNADNFCTYESKIKNISGLNKAMKDLNIAEEKLIIWAQRNIKGYPKFNLNSKSILNKYAALRSVLLNLAMKGKG